MQFFEMQPQDATNNSKFLKEITVNNINEEL
jgi:hypothetical protein